MKLIILAAGEGTRLRPYTLNRPKCMVEYNGIAIIDRIINAAKSAGIEKITVVDGYKHEVLRNHLHNRDVTFSHNPLFNVTNMVASLFSAEDELNDDVIISYADIIYQSNILNVLLKSENDFSVVVDKDWFKLWSLRMDDPLSDAETLKLNIDGSIKELGKKALSLSEVEGQYIGLIKIKREALQKVRKFYHQLDKSKMYDGKNFENMFMTSFIQMIIDELMPVAPVFINGGWLEIDSVSDLEAYTKSNFIIAP